MKKYVLSLVFTISLLIPSAAFAQTAVRITPAERKIAETIKADRLSNWLHFIASDAMAGRDTPSQGLDITAEFLKMKLSRWGFKPAGDNGTFFQKMTLKMDSVNPANNTVRIGDQNYELNSDFFRLGGNASAKAEMVFAGHGWMVKGKDIDAYRGVDVKGKVVVLYDEGMPNRANLTNLPQGVTNADLSGTKGADWADPLTYASQNGAAGIVLVASPGANNAWGQLRNFYSRGGMYVEGLRERPAPSTLPVVMVSSKAGDAIFAGQSAGRDSRSGFSIDRAISLTVGVKTETKYTQNVVALWEGSDPVLKNEMVAIGAHYDHVGTNPNAPGDDKIWNGADDDGSGTVAMLAMAEALAVSRTRPKRSILFVWHAGEEKGLWGAEYFNKFPTVNIKNVIAQLNIDMIGRSKDPNNLIPCDQPRKPCNDELAGANEVYVIGSEMMSTTLGEVTRATNAAYERLDYNFKYDDPLDKNRFFFRSDHYHYAVNGIPVVFWFTGVHEDYHQPTDHAYKIDYPKLEKITRTIFLTMWKLSELKVRPAVDKELPPELRQR